MKSMQSPSASPWRKARLSAAALALTAIVVWLTMPASQPIPDAAPTFSMDSIFRQAPPDLPTLTADTF